VGFTRMVPGTAFEVWGSVGPPMGEVQAQVSAGLAMDDKERRKRLASLPFLKS